MVGLRAWQSGRHRIRVRVRSRVSFCMRDESVRFICLSHSKSRLLFYFFAVHRRAVKTGRQEGGGGERVRAGGDFQMVFQAREGRLLNRNSSSCTLSSTPFFALTPREGTNRSRKRGEASQPKLGSFVASKLLVRLASPRRRRDWFWAVGKGVSAPCSLRVCRRFLYFF